MSASGSYPPSQDPPAGLGLGRLGYVRGAPVGFREAVVGGILNAFVYHGRASRSALWWFFLFQGMISILWLALFIPLSSAKGSNIGFGVAAFVLGIPVFYLELASLALLVRRLHDTDRSGWWLLIWLVPYLGGIVLLVFSVLRGTPGPNRYSPGPEYSG